MTATSWTPLGLMCIAFSPPENTCGRAPLPYAPMTAGWEAFLPLNSQNPNPVLNVSPRLSRSWSPVPLRNSYFALAIDRTADDGDWPLSESLPDELLT